MKENNIGIYIKGYIYGVVLSLACFAICSLYFSIARGIYIELRFVSPHRVTETDISAIKQTIAYENGLELIEVPQKRK